MIQTPNFQIFSASAGSGKTFNIVRLYLGILLRSKDLTKFKNILAITFTNKAVGEMKERVIDTLKEFSEPEILDSNNKMMELLSEDLKLTPKEIHDKSKLVLEFILHNYGALDISTIDKFNHRILRIFAKDMKLPNNFDVEMDVDLLLNRAVDRLIDKVGQENELTKLLIDFAVEKTDDDRSWDISYDLNLMAKILLKETDWDFIKKLEGKSIEDFKKLKKLINLKLDNDKDLVLKLANHVLELFENNGLEFKDFYRSVLPNHFLKISEGETDVRKLYGNQLENNLLNKTSLYTKTQTDIKVAVIESLVPEILEKYQKIKVLIPRIVFHKNILRDVVPLTVLHLLNESLKEIKAEEDLLLISEFNELISKELRDQPAPYIYERMGERYQHYFIDEFQDTSGMQWENLIPLIENSLSGLTNGEPGSLVLVGDVKQAIYRWRGGKAELLLNLLNKEKNPFPVKVHEELLQNNFRSRADIVAFNNELFQFVGDSVLNLPKHKDLYFKSGQISNSEDPGYIQIEFCDTKSEDKNDNYPSKCLQSINELISEGYRYGDICILVRKNKQGAEIANLLAEHSINVVSPDSLLLKNSEKNKFLLAFMQLLLQPSNKEAKIKVLEFIADFSNVSEPHNFYIKYLGLKDDHFFQGLEDLGYHIPNNDLKKLPFYETIEYLVFVFKLNKETDAYLVAFLDEVYKYSLQERLGMEGFLEYWDKKKDKLSIQAPETDSAISIMTIHKAKGLQFPVVLLPYASETLISTRDNKIWFEVNPEEYAGFQYMYTSVNKALYELNNKGKEAYEEFEAQSKLDSINLLYVALTRPEERLYIFTDLPSENITEIKKYPELFQQFLVFKNLWDGNKQLYEIGKKVKLDKPQMEFSESGFEIISTPRISQQLEILSKNGLMWDTVQENALEKGNLIHEILARLDTLNDLEPTIQQLYNEGLISSHQIDDLKSVIMHIVNHPKLSEYFNNIDTIYKERDILTPDGQQLRPDRIIIKDGKATIIDYKTGLEKNWHVNQLNTYSQLIENMGIQVVSKILVYIDRDVAIKEF